MVKVVALPIPVLAITCLSQSIWGISQMEMNTPYKANSSHNEVLEPSIWKKYNQKLDFQPAVFFLKWNVLVVSDIFSIFQRDNSPRSVPYVTLSFFNCYCYLFKFLLPDANLIPHPKYCLLTSCPLGLCGVSPKDACTTWMWLDISRLLMMS